MFVSTQAIGSTITQNWDGVTAPALPSGWTLSGTYGTSTYLKTVTSASNPTVSSSGEHSTPNMIYFNSYSVSGTGNLISPVIDWSGACGATPTVSVWVYRDLVAYNTSVYNAEGVTVYVNTSAALGGTALGFVPRRGGYAASGTYLTTSTNLTVGTTGWYQYSFNIPASYNTATNYLIFSFAGLAGDNTYIDDVQYSSYPSISSTSGGGAWSSTGTWVGGVVPGAGASVIINGPVTSGSMTNTGCITVAVAGNLEMAGTLTNNGTVNVLGTLTLGVGSTGGYVSNTAVSYSGTSSTLVFNNTGSPYGVNTGQAFWPVSNPPYNVTVNGSGVQTNMAVGPVAGTLTVNAELDMPTAVTVNGTLLLNNGGYINANAPIYGASSLLQYNGAGGGTPGRYNEWNATGVGTIGTTPGYPNNVQISSNTTLDLGANGGSSTARAMAGNLTIDDGSKLTMANTPMTASLTVGGNVTLGSGGTGATFVQSTSSGGDLVINGNWTRNTNSILTTNQRQVTFSGSTAQTITGNTTFDYLKIANTYSTPTVTLQASSPVTVNYNLNMSAGLLVLGANNLTVTAGTSSITSSSTSYIQTNSTGQLIQTVGSSQVKYPVGNTAYDPIWLTNGGASGTCGVVCNTFNTGSTGWSALNDNANAIVRSWTVVPSSAANLGVKAQWNSTTEEKTTATFASSVSGSAAAYVGMYNGSVWTEQASSISGYPGSTPYIASTANASGTLTATNSYVFTVGMGDCFLPLPATVVLASANPSAPIAAPAQGSTNNVISAFTLAVTSANATLNGASGLQITTTGNYAVTTDVINLKLWYQTAATGGSTFNAGTATLLSTLSSSSTPALSTLGTQTFPAFTNQTIASGATGYFFITADLACATTGHTIGVNAVTTSNFAFTTAPGSFTGTAYAGGTQTFAGGTFTWAGGASNSWATAANWSPASVPCAGANVIFNTPSAITVTNVPTISLSSISISGSAVILKPVSGGATVTLANSATALAVPSGAALTLQSVSGGAITLNYTSGSTNTATIGGTLSLTSYNGTNIATYNATNSATTISGTLNINDAVSTITSTSSNTTVTSTGNVNMNYAAANVPAATWNAGTFPAGATLTFPNSSTALNIAVPAGQTLYNVVYNSGTVAANPSFNGTLTNLAGTLTVTNTSSGSASLLLSNSSTSTAYTASIANIVVNGGQLFINYGNGASTVTVSGNVTVSSSNLFVCGQTGTTILNVLGTFSQSGGNTNIAWSNTGSTIGSGTLNVTGTLTQTGGTINCTSGGAGTGTLNVTGAMSIAGVLNLMNSATGVAAAVTVGTSSSASSLTVTGNGEILMQPTAPTGTPGTATIYIYGNFTANGSGSSSSNEVVDWGAGTNAQISGNTITLTGNYSHSGSGNYYVTRGTSDALPTNVGFVFAGSGIQTYSETSSVTALAYASFTINSGSTLQLNTNFIVPTGPFLESQLLVNGTIDCGSSYSILPASVNTQYDCFFNLASGGTLKTANANGVVSGTSGSVYAVSSSGFYTGQSTFSNGANYYFYGSGAQSTNFSNSTMARLTIANTAAAPAGVTLTSSPTVTGTLTLTSGILNLNGYNLTNNGTLSGGSSSSYLFTLGATPGSYITNTSTSGPTLLPLGSSDKNANSSGTALYYTPVTIGATSSVVTLTSSVLIGASGIPSPSTLAVPTQVAVPVWNVTSSGATTANVTFNWLAANDSTTTAPAFSPSTNCDLGIWNGAAWVANSIGSAPTGSYTITASGVAIPSGGTNKWIIGNHNCITTPPDPPTGSITNVSPSYGDPVAGSSSNYPAFNGAVITITGTNLASVTVVKVGGSGGTAATIVGTTSSNSLQFYLPSGASGQVYLQNSGGNVTTSNSIVNLGYLATAAGDWSGTGASAPWLNNSGVPGSGATVTIGNPGGSAVTVTLSTNITTNPASITVLTTGVLNINNNASAVTTTTVVDSGTLTFSSTGALTATTVTNTGTLSWTAAGTLNIAASGSVTNAAGSTFTSGAGTVSFAGGGSGGTLTNNSATYTTGTGTVTFLGAGTIAGSQSVSIYNINIAGGLTLTTPPTVTHYFTINTNGYVASAPPIYGSASTLVYNVLNALYVQYNEWSSTSTIPTAATSGVPFNVTVQNGTVLNMSTGNHSMWGSLTIAASSSGVNNSQFNLNSGGGNLYIGGSWTDNVTSASSPLGFTHNNQTVIFGGTAAQTITAATTATGGELFYGLTVQGSGYVKLANNITVAGSNGLSLTSSNGTYNLDLGGKTLALSGGGTMNVGSGLSAIIGNSTGTGTFAISAVTSMTGGGSLTFGNNTICLLTSGMSFTSTTIGTAAGTGTILRIGSGGYVSSPPSYATGSLLQYYSGTVYGRSVEWSTNVGAGYPYNVEVSNGTTLAPAGTSTSYGGQVLQMAGNLTIDASCYLYLQYGSYSMSTPLTVLGTVTINGTLGQSTTSISGGDVVIKGSGTAWTLNTGGSLVTNSVNAVSFSGSSGQTIGGTLSTSFYNLIINNSANVTLGINTSVTNNLTFSSGLLVLSTYSLTTAPSFTGGSATSYVATNSSGNMIVNAITTTPVAIPIGFGTTVTTSYAPLTITGTSTSANYTLNVTTPYPGSPLVTAQMVNIAWSVTASTAQTGAAITFGWNAANDGGSYVTTGPDDLGVYSGSTYTTPYSPTTFTPTGTSPTFSLATTGINIPTSSNKFVIGNAGCIICNASSTPGCITSGAASVAAGQTVVTWTAPSCYDQVMVVVSPAANTGGTPSGTGSAYTPNTVYASGTAFGNGYVTYLNNGSGSTGVTVTGLTNGTTYYVKFFTRKGSNWSVCSEITVTPSVSYCASTQATGTIYAWITNIVTTGGIGGNNISNATGNTGYTLYTSPYVSQYAGSSLTLSTITIHGIGGGVGFGVWVDWDNNGTFGNNTNEIIYNTTSQISTSPAPVTITVPSGQAPGNYRMRIVTDFLNSAASPCNSALDGETEDYIFNVAPTLTPTITLVTNNIAAGNIAAGSVSNPIYSFGVTVATTSATLTGLNVTTTSGSNNTYAASGADLTNLKAWYSSTSSFNASTATLLSTLTSPAVASATLTFPSFTSQSIPVGTGYIFITADLPCGATVGHNITLNAVTASNTTFTSGTPTGTPAAGNTQSIVAHTPTTYYWRGGSTGLWTTNTNWSTSSSSTVVAGIPECGDAVVFDATSGTATITAVPTVSLASMSATNTAAQITLQPGSANAAITLTGTGNALSIVSGALITLDASAGTTNISLGYSGSSVTPSIAGTLTLNSGTSGGVSTYTATGATTSVSGTLNINDNVSVVTSTSSNLSITGTGNVNMNGNATVIPTANWTSSGATSTITLAGTGTSFTGLGQNFYNMTINEPSVGGNILFNGALGSIAGTLTLQNNVSAYYYVSLTTSLATTVSIANISVSANGSLILTDGAANCTVNVSGSVTNNGIMQFNLSTGSATMNVTGSVTNSAGAIYINSSSGSTTGTLSITGSYIGNGGYTYVTYNSGAGTMTVGGTAAISSGRLYGSYNNGPSTITVTGLTTLSGGTILGQDASVTTATFNLTGGLTMTGGTFVLNLAYTGSGNSSTLNMNGVGAAFNQSGGTFAMVDAYGNATINMTDPGSSFTLATGATFYMNASTSSATPVPVINLSGSFAMTGGTLDWNHATTAYQGGSINVAGAFSISGTPTITASYKPKYGSGQFIFNGSAQNLSNTSTGTLNFTTFTEAGTGSAGVGTLTGNFAIQDGSTTTCTDSFVVASTATLVCGTNIVNDNSNTKGRFYNYGTLSMGLSPGITTVATGASGNIQVGGVRSFAITGNYTYAGASTPQATGNALPATVNNLTIANTASSGAVQMTNSALAINGNLIFSSGNFDLNGSNNVTLSSTSSITGESCSGGTLIVNSGSPSATNGYISITQTVNTSTTFPVNPGNIGINISGVSANLGSTTFKRFPKAVSAAGISNATQGSIKRIYSIKSTTAATMTASYAYCTSELNGNTDGIMSTFTQQNADETVISPTYMLSSTISDVSPNVVSALALSSTTKFITFGDPDQVCTANNGDWNVGLTWSTGTVPLAGQNICINNTLTVTAANTALTGNISLNSGSLTITSPYQVNVGAGKTFTNNLGSAAAATIGGTGAVNFSNGGTITGTAAGNSTTFNNLVLTTGTLNISNTTGYIPTIGTNFTIKGGSVTHPPIYSNGTSSSGTLTYDPGSGNVYTRYVEWNAASGAGTTPGFPNNVTVNSGTLYLSSATANPANCNNVFQVNTGATASMSGVPSSNSFTSGSMNITGTFDMSNSASSANTSALTINAGGTVTLGTTTNPLNVTGNMSNSGTLTLSTNSAGGGDIHVTGNWTRTGGSSPGVFTPNGRAVFLEGTGTQVVKVSGHGTETFNYLFVNGSGTMQLAEGTANADSTDVVVNTANGLTLGSTNGTSTIDLNGRYLKVTGGGNLSLTSTSVPKYITSTTGTGALQILSNAATLTNTGTLNFGTNTILDLQTGLEPSTAGSLHMNSGSALQLSANGYIYNTAHPPLYASGSTLVYNTGGTFTAQPSAEWLENNYGTGVGVPNNVSITSGSELNFNASGYPHEMTGTLNINGTLDLNSGTPGADFYIKGDWHLNSGGTFNCNGRLVEFDGTSTQNLYGATTFDYVKLSNNAGLTLNNDMTINQVLTFYLSGSSSLLNTSGIITTGSNKVFINTTANGGLAGYGITSGNGPYYIYGNLRRLVTAASSGHGNYDFPVGTASTYELANITFGSTALGSTTYLDANFTSGVVSTLPGASAVAGCYINGSKITNILNGGFWTIHPDNQLTAGSYSSTLYLIGSTNIPASHSGFSGSTPTTITPGMQLGLIKRTSAVGATIPGPWLGCGDSIYLQSTSAQDAKLGSIAAGGATVTGSGSTAVVQVVRSSVASFSDFGVGIEADNNYALPVELMNFTANNVDNNAILNWATASENNNNYFGIERSVDGITFEQIGQVQGHGNSVTTINYEYTDPNISSYHVNVLYYRLKQVDLDGNYQYSDIVAVNVSNEAPVFYIISSYPNPFTDHFSISFYSPTPQPIKMSVYDVRGALVREETINASTGMNVYTIPDGANLASGFYTMSVGTQQKEYGVKMLKVE